MTLTELLPALHRLPRDEKFRAMQLLAVDVAGEDEDAVKDSEGAYPIWSPCDAFEGAATLMRMPDEPPRFPFLVVEDDL